MIDKKTPTKNKETRKLVKQNRFYVGLTKKSSTFPSVVWAEESRTGLKFEIGPSYDVVPTRSQLVTDGQSSCRGSLKLAKYKSQNWL